MKRFLFPITIAVVSGFFFALNSANAQYPPSAPSGAPLAGAVLSDWKGDIRLDLPGHTSSSPLRGRVLPAGTLLETGNGRLLLRLADGSQVLVRAHTRLQVLEPVSTDPSYFRVLLGRIRAFVNKRTGGSAPFQLGTPSAVIAVRGTQFEVEVNQRNITEVDVVEGLVEVSGLHGASVLLEPGFSTRISEAGNVESPRPTEEIRPDVERPDREADGEQEREFRQKGLLRENRERDNDRSEDSNRRMEREKPDREDTREPEGAEPPSSITFPVRPASAPGPASHTRVVIHQVKSENRRITWWA